MLAELEKRADKVRSGIRSRSEDAVIDHQSIPLADHFDAYLTNLEAEGTSPMHRDNVERCLTRIASDCGRRQGLSARDGNRLGLHHPERGGYLGEVFWQPQSL